MPYNALFRPLSCEYADIPHGDQVYGLAGSEIAGTGLRRGATNSRKWNNAAANEPSATGGVYDLEAVMGCLSVCRPRLPKGCF